MAETSVVTQEDLADGARLIQLLDEENLPVTAACWAYDSVLEMWRFIIALPQDLIESLIQAYGIIQGILADNGLAVALDRINLIPDDDPKIADLRALAESDLQDVVEIPVGRAEIAGRLFDPVLLYRTDALRYERDVVTALRRMEPADTLVLSYERPALPLARQADAQIDTDDRIIIVETKVVSRLLGSKDVVQVEIMRSAYQRYYDRPVIAIVVSRTEFALSAEERARNSGILLVHWAGPEDDDKIQGALTQALSSP